VTIASAYKLLGPLLGPAAAGAFLLSLIVSGLSSAVVGTMAGQIVMQGFVGFRIPVWLRRLITMCPAFAVIAIGVEPSNALVLSQIVLSLALPLPMIPLVAFTRRRDIMGPLANSAVTHCIAIGAMLLILSVDFVLLVHQVVL
jgi:manganese transport protein